MYIHRRTLHARCRTAAGSAYLLTYCRGRPLSRDVVESVETTSGESNLTKKGRIAAARGRFSRIRHTVTAPYRMHPDNTCFIRPSRESTSQTASRSVQPFLHSSAQRVPILYNGRPLCASKLPLRMDPNLTQWFLGPTSPESTTQTASRSASRFLTE